MEVEKKLQNRFKIGTVEYKVNPSKTGKGYDIFKNQGGRWKIQFTGMTLTEVIQYQTNDFGEHLNRLNFLSILSRKKK
jgi:hypothetical protein